MASTSWIRRRVDELHWDDRGSARTKFLAVLVAIMTVAGVVSLVLVLTGNDGSSNSVAQQPANSQVGRQSSTTAPAPATTSAAPSAAVPAPTSAASPVTAPSTSATPTAPKTSNEPVTTAAAPTKPITYTVKKGDNLTVIAAWFHQHGYGSLYERNKSVIGDNPNLIFPGQRITVSSTGVSLDGK